jgi:amino acid adenylation domain-containing protein
MSYQSVQEMFREAAARFKDHTAIDYANKRTTYATLDAEANKLANFLVASGAPKGSIVAILIEDPVQVITAIIGILRAGCVFVPLDPSIPEQRLEAMVAAVSPGWFLFESRFSGVLERIATGPAATASVICADRTVVLDTLPSSLAQIEGYASFSNTEPPTTEYQPDDMCYVFFTSGSTGKPKGITGRLKGIDHFIKWEIKALGLTEGTRVSQLTTPAFDAVLRDIFVPLCAGGTICIPPGRDTILDTKKLIDWIDIQGINVIHCVPSLFRAIVNEDLNADYFAELTHILMAGEPLLPSDVGKWVEKFGDRVQLVNLYGPSETTMTKFAYFVKPSDKELESIPIGKPIEGTAAVLVDAENKICAPGTVGEIYIRTPFRTHGYYNQPELTQQVFIPNPFGKDPNDIVYKTGDLGRVMPDGNFEFLGRRDLQVKIRGTRIELSEIDKLLRAHEAVKDLAVIDREDASGTKFLCAYVVLGRQVETGAFRDYLSSRLPAEMVPSAFVLMDKLPRTISGKIDRKALPAPGQLRADLEKPFAPPRTPIEVTLAEIWVEVLGIDRVGINDNFFEMGGHSLLVFQVISRTRDAFGVDLPLRTLFEAPTVEKQALAIVAAQLDQENDAEMAQLIEEIRLLEESELENMAEETLQLVAEKEGV